MQTQKQINYEAYMNTEMKNYIGEWVVICDGKIVSHGVNLKEAVSKATAKCGNRKLMLAKIPEKETMIY